jgi:hypothetical protein
MHHHPGGIGYGWADMSIKRDQADIWCSKVVRARDGQCIRCGTTEGLEAMHVVGRKSKILRYSLDNLASGCHRCHRYFTENPLQFIDHLTMVWGEGHMQLLREKARENLKTTKELRKEISKHYREQFKLMEADPEHEPISWN